MADEPSTTVTPETVQAAPGEAVEPAGEPDGTDWKAEARKWEQRAKDNREAARQLEQQRKAAMTESERAVAEAEERGRTAAVSTFGARLARGEWIAEAAKRNPGYNAADALEDLNLAKFIGDDGEPDSKAIAASVARLVPEANSGIPQPPSFDGGTRQPIRTGSSMSDLIRQATGRG